MKIGIYKPKFGDRDPDMSIYRQILDFNKIDYEILDINEIDFFKKVQKLNYFIYRWGPSTTEYQIASTILPIIEKNLGVKCFPNWNTSWHHDDKIKQYFLLKNENFPVPESVVFFDKDKALEWAEIVDFPQVFKLRSGAGSSNVILIKSKDKAISLIRKMFGSGVKSGKIGGFQNARYSEYDFIKEGRSFLIKFRNYFVGREISAIWQKEKNYVYFQKFLKNNTFDTRVTTCGEKVHAFRRFMRKNDFRASGGNHWDSDPNSIDERILKIALEISGKFDFQTMAYDFMYNKEGKPVVIEMTYMYGTPGLPDFQNGYWNGPLLDRVEGRYWPQLFDLQKFLGIENLAQPEIKVPSQWLKYL